MTTSEYLADKKVQEVIQEGLNELVKEKPEDPFTFLADYLRRRSTAGGPKIAKVVGREVLDSRGNPTVEVDVYIDAAGKAKFVDRGSAPSGASTGSNEALELRDKEAKDRYLGKGTTQAVQNVNSILNKALTGAVLDSQRDLDKIICDADGTELKTNVGGNAVTAASFAIALASSRVKDVETFDHFASAFYGDVSKANWRLPTPLVNILNGGKHAGGKLKIQEFMIVPQENIPFTLKLRQSAEVYHHLGKILVAKYGVSAKNLGDEGGFAPFLDTAEEALTVIEEAIQAAGYKVGDDIRLALDCAASEFYDKEKGYEIQEGVWKDSDGMVEFYGKLIEDHPALISIEDALDEKDYDGWKKFTAAHGDKVMVVGDDLYTTNTNLIKKGIEEKWANALLLKVNQIGTVSEAMDAAQMIYDDNGQVIVSHRSGETPSGVIADLAVGIGAGFIKTGATARGERIAKYNRLLQIEELLIERGLVKYE